MLCFTGQWAHFEWALHLGVDRLDQWKVREIEYLLVPPPLPLFGQSKVWMFIELWNNVRTSRRCRSMVFLVVQTTSGSVRLFSMDSELLSHPCRSHKSGLAVNSFICIIIYIGTYRWNISFWSVPTYQTCPLYPWRAIHAAAQRNWGCKDILCTYYFGTMMITDKEQQYNSLLFHKEIHVVGGGGHGCSYLVEGRWVVK